MTKLRLVSKKEYEDFLKDYVGETVPNMITIVEPPFEVLHDKKLLKENGNKFSLNSIIAQKSIEENPEYYIKG